MIRLLNFFCFAVTAFACLALYHISEEARVARVELRSVERQISDQEQAMKVLGADWERVADPARIQRLAARRLGVGDQPVALASLELLPRKPDDLQQANAEASPSDPHLQTASLHAGQ